MQIRVTVDGVKVTVHKTEVDKIRRVEKMLAMFAVHLPASQGSDEASAAADSLRAFREVMEGMMRDNEPVGNDKT